MKLFYITWIILIQLALTACGGGLFGDSKPASASFVRLANPPTPTILSYNSFDLANSMNSGKGILGGGYLVQCQSVNTAHPDWPYNTSTLQIESSSGNGFSFSVSGNFTLPYGDIMTCNTNGMSGTISSVAINRLGTPIYLMNNLNIDAASIQNTWREFWQSVLAKNGSIMVSQPSSAIITCTNLMGQNLSIAASPVRDISNEIRNCIN